MSESVYSLHEGRVPLLLSLPHIGTRIPEDVLAGYHPRARGVEDTDWHLARVYDFALQLGASVLTPTVSRYVIDLNRPPGDAPMYPGASNTELCPTRFFTGDPLYLPGMEPTPDERARRLALYWRPYHEALAAELERIRCKHGFALLWDGHSIRSEIPWLFEGRLPDLNIGTVSGESASPKIAEAIARICSRNKQLTHVVNGRFKGGYITRNYGRPVEDIHAVQLEMTQCLYMSEVAPFDLDEAKLQALRPILKDMVSAALEACREQYERR